VKSPEPAGAEAVSHLHVGARRASERSAAVALEGPLEIRLDDEPVAVTMRTPGHDVELGLGFLVTEGVIETPDAIAAAALCDDNPNVLEVRTTPGAAGVHRPAARNFYTTSSCGVCGKASIDAVRVRAPGLHGDDVRVDARVLAALPERLRGAQTLFGETGSVHAAGLFDARGNLLCAREDVGRHNAVDKVIGWATLEERLPLRGHVLLVSGRAGFEIAQKALVAGIPIMGAISGPSSLAVELTREGGMTLVAFLRGREMNVYSGAERIALS
jgi:FdhD protein